MRMWFLTLPRVRKRRLQNGQQYFLRVNLVNGLARLPASFLSAALTVADDDSVASFDAG